MFMRLRQRDAQIRHRSEGSWSNSQVVPIYNDVEGEQVPDNFVLNSSSLLQEIHPSFHRNIRGYRWDPGVTTVRLCLVKPS